MKDKKRHISKHSKLGYPITKLRPFEFRIFKSIRNQGLAGKKLLVACSGGRDSMALLACLETLAGKIGFSLGAAFIHHGPANREITRYRKEAFKTVQKHCLEMKVHFHTEKSAKKLSSEDSLRDFRLRALGRIQKAFNYDAIVFGHHADDLFETRVIRLIRGTGPQGLEAMSLHSDGVLRPFLGESSAEIATYAVDRSLKWVEDPSNSDTEPLRNWLRKSWLPALEGKRPGALRSFARSLELLASISHFEQRSAGFIEGIKRSDESIAIDRGIYLKLEIAERQKLLAAYLLQLGAREFSAKHIQEIRKRIEISRKEIRFRLLKLDWEINAEQIRAVQEAVHENQKVLRR